jgi:hypothetical protein
LGWLDLVGSIAAWFLFVVGWGACFGDRIQGIRLDHVHGRGQRGSSKRDAQHYCHGSRELGRLCFGEDVEPDKPEDARDEPSIDPYHHPFVCVVNEVP